ncbi:MAG TPA: ABC transporter substrate-binding protein, partial [Ferruginibacter sp.]|nr:ABC transporter substrate-binding protein [Ferruginibacter sp.]
MNKLLSFIISVILLPLTLIVNAQPKQVKLQLKWWHQFQFAGYYAADIKGFYSDAGLNVSILTGNQHKSPVPEVINGYADFGITGSDLLVNYSEGMPVKVLGAIFQHSPYVIISPEKNNILTPADFIGKKIMCSQNQGLVEIKALALKYGIPLDSITFLEHTWKNEDIINGHANAMTGYSSVEIYQLLEKGISVNMVKPVNYGLDFYGDVIFSLKKTVDDRQGYTDQFLEATYKGWEYAMKHPAEIADYILTLPGVKERGVTKQALLFEAAEMKKLVLPDLVEMGHMSESRWQDILDVYKSLKMVPQNQTLKGFVYNSEKEKEKNYLGTGLLILGGILIIVALLFSYSLSLKLAVKKRTLQLEKEIIQRKKHEEGLEKLSKELQYSNSEMQQFAYLISHNLRAPVTNLLSLVKLFDKESLTEKNRTYFDKIAFSTNNFNQMLTDLNEILSARKDEQVGMLQITFEDELNNVKLSISETMRENQLIIHADFSKAPNVYCTPEILQSILLNLITNTIKFKKPGNLPEIKFASEEKGDFIMLTISDKGLGMNLEKHGDKLFNLYQRFHPNIEGKGM